MKMKDAISFVFENYFCYLFNQEYQLYSDASVKEVNAEAK